MIKYDKLSKNLKENAISRSQIQRLKNNQSVTTHILNMILNILGERFTLNDIAEFTPDAKEAK